MICKGRSRGDGGQLAAYLEDRIGEPKNDSAKIMEVRGFVGRDLRQMLRDAEDEATRFTRGSKPLYHAQLAPDHGERLSREQALEAVAILERRLGFEGLSRVVVEHVKDGNPHFHVAWSRYDRETGELRAHPHDARRRMEAAREIEERFGLRVLDQEAQPGDDRTHAEHQQDGRASKSRKERHAEITALWQATDSGKAFAAALDAAGYTLATGKRGFVIVDAAGEVHSLARQIDGAKKADVDARLADLDRAVIPDAEAIRAALRQARGERPRPGKGTEAGRDPGPDPAGPMAGGPRLMPGVDEEAQPRTASEHLAALTRQHSTFTLAELERYAARFVGFEGREAWMTQRGGLDALTPEMKASAERSHERWLEDRAQAGERGGFGLAAYVAYVQDRDAERERQQAPEKRAERERQRAAFAQLVKEIGASPELVQLGPDRRGRARYTTWDMLDVEMRMEAAAADLAGRSGHAVKAKTREAAVKHTQQTSGRTLTPEQRAALDHITGKEGLALVVGFAGTGKSTMLDAARATWEAAGLRVTGTALAGIAAEGLQSGSGIKSRNLHQLLHRLDTADERRAALAAMDTQLAGITGRSQKAQRFRADLRQRRDDLAADLDATTLSKRDVLVVDEAGMIGSRQMERLLRAAHAAGAKVVLVGDAEQLQAIDAGGPFRAFQQRHGAAEIRTIQRQADTEGIDRAWQRQAVRDLAEERTIEGLAAYAARRLTHETESREDAKAGLVAAWSRDREERAGITQLMLAHTRADVAALNEAGRAAYRAEGRLGEDHRIETATGAQDFATGDRLYFTKGSARHGVNNGSLGTVLEIEDSRLTVRLDGRDGRTVQIDTRHYDHIAHGYASTVHKNQGATTDRAYVLATGGMDRHLAYVAMSRHRDQAELWHSREDFKDFAAMARRLSRDGTKDTTLDYLDRAETGQQTPTPSLRQAFGEVWQRVKQAFGWSRVPLPEQAAAGGRTSGAEAPTRPQDPLAAILDTPTPQAPGPRQPTRDDLAAALGGAAGERKRPARRPTREGPDLDR